MNTKDKIDALQFLVSTHRGEFESRRSFQFKAISGVIVLMGLAITARVNEKSHAVVSALPDWIIWTAVALVAATGSAFLFFVHSANAFNKLVAHRAEEAIQEAIKNVPDSPLDLYRKPDKQGISQMFKIGNGGYWGWLFESILIMVFAIITALVLTS
ncbi:hypothetical protein [Vibrio cincinnatiensis]|uniref:hypothetical protein n=1 Tax=Vibrio cincinnatiensis TaxID=675 RepID=UPI001EE0C614|nr:hypothetical protein [Vibrio cincinnatiensis]MCG3731097.1 hypothetical protein [Vibrio cincinnatiensis]